MHRSTGGGTRGGSVKLKHRIHKPIVTYTNSSKQTVLLVNGVGNGKLPSTTEQEEDGRKNYSRNAQATKHVVKMLGEFRKNYVPDCQQPAIMTAVMLVA